MAHVKVFNYGAHTARDYWNLVAKPDLEEFHRLRSPLSVAHVVQSLWGLLEWYAQEQGSEAKCYFPLLPELEWIRDIAYSLKHRALTRKPSTKHMATPKRAHWPTAWPEVMARLWAVIAVPNPS
jgi:hypothetical protein